MEKFEYTQCSLNLKNKKAIVYRFANGDVSEITAADFDGDEEMVRRWKRLSDKYYIDERDLMYRISYKDVSINGLDETDLAALSSMEDVLVMREDDIEFTEEMNAFLDTLTDSQRKRLELRAFRDKSQTEIAEIEHIGQPRIHKSFVQISQKFKNFIENGASMGIKTRFFILGRGGFKMILNYTPERIKELIKNMNNGEPYPDDYLYALDEKLDGARVLATNAKKLLKIYFEQHPEDSIDNYI